jgi:hypothetical protein
MKKVKVMLTAIAVLTIVGGSLAFKAKEDKPLKCYFTTATGSAQCIFRGILSVSTTQDNSGTFKAITTSTTTTQIGGAPTCTVGVGNPNPLNCLTALTEIE